MRKFFLPLFLGATLVFGLEFGLRGLGVALLFWQSFVGRTSSSSLDKIQIVALGESTTAELGGAAPKSWPRLLGDELTAKGHNAEVINLSVGGITSPQLIGRFAQYLSTHESPQIVITMMGINDDGRSKFRLSGLITDDKDSFFAHLRIAKLAKFLFNIPQIVAVKRGLQSTRPRLESLGLPVGVSAKQLAQIRGYLNSGNQKGADLLIKSLLVGVTDKTKSSFYAYLANDLRPAWGSPMADFSNSYRYAKESLRLGLTNDFMAEVLAFLAPQMGKSEDCTWLAQRYLALGVSPSEVTMVRLSSCYRPESEEVRSLRKRYYSYLDISHTEGLEQTRESYHSLAMLLRNQNTCWIAMQYPMRPIQSIMDYFERTDLDHSLNVTFLENQKLFLQALEDHNMADLFVDLFAGNFGHATLLGNQLIARNAAETIQRIVTLKTCKN